MANYTDKITHTHTKGSNNNNNNNNHESQHHNKDYRPAGVIDDIWMLRPQE
jgi:hypothetical protein